MDTPPFVLAIMGIPGAGKTTLCEWLRERLDVRVVSRDVIRAALFDPCTFTDAEKAAAFRSLLDAIRVNARLDQASIIDGMCFSTSGQLEQVERAAVDNGARFIAVHCECPVHVAQQRVEEDLREGTHLADDRDPSLVQKVAERFRSIPEWVIKIDGTESPDRVGPTILKSLGQQLNS